MAQFSIEKMFVKASKMTSVGTEDMNMFSFDPAKIPLFFFPVSEHEKTSSLPLATTLCSAARELNVVQRFRVFPIEEKAKGKKKKKQSFPHQYLHLFYELGTLLDR